VLRSQELRVGVNPTLPPRALFNERNVIDGFEPKIAAALAQKLGVRLALQAVGSPERIPMVASGRIDFMMGAMSRTSERAKVIDYSVPVHSENHGIVAIAGRGLTSFEALNRAEVTLAQVRGTTAIPFIQRRIPRAQVLLLDNYPDCNRAIPPSRRAAHRQASMASTRSASRCARSTRCSGRSPRNPPSPPRSPAQESRASRRRNGMRRRR